MCSRLALSEGLNARNRARKGRIVRVGKRTSRIIGATFPDWQDKGITESVLSQVCHRLFGSLCVRIALDADAVHGSQTPQDLFLDKGVVTLVLKPSRGSKGKVPLLECPYLDRQALGVPATGP